MASNNHINWKTLDRNIRKAVRSSAGSLKIKDTAEYPLAFKVEMPDGTEFRYGDMSFLFSDFQAEGVDQLSLNLSTCRQEGHKIFVGLQFSKIRISGKYAIKAKQAPFIDMDTAGNMMELEEEESLSEVAGADSAGGAAEITVEEKQAFLDNANKQKENLYKTPNGQKLMETYKEHNEVYNEVFIKSKATRTTWHAKGATAEMARDTHEAVNKSDIVNSATKLYAGQVTYNGNSFNQQLNIVVNTASTDPNFNPWDPDARPDPNSKYIKASLAALDFGKAVNTTGNTDKEVRELTSDQVYNHVHTFDEEPPKADVKELQNIVSQGAGDGGAAEAMEKGWVVLNEEQRKMVKRWMLANVREKAERENYVTMSLWTGNCGALISNTAVEMECSRGETGSGFQVENTTIDLPVFEFEVDDAHWTGKASEVIRERLAQIYFVKSLIHNQIERGIKSLLGTCVANALNLSVVK